MVRQAGLEPATYASEAHRSIQLKLLPLKYSLSTVYNIINEKK